MIKSKKPLKRSILIGILIFVLLLCAVLSAVQYCNYRTVLYSRYEVYIENLLRYVEGEIDADDLAECIRTGQESDKFRALQTVLDNIRDRVNIHFIYVIIPLHDGPLDNIQNVIAGVSREEYETIPDQLVSLNMLTGDSYSPQTARKYLNAYNSGRLSFFEKVSEWGGDYTGLLPLLDSAGRRVAALCIDVDVAEIHGALRQNVLTVIVLILLLGLAFAVVFFRWTERNVTQPIVRLETSVVEYAAKCQAQKDPEALRIDVPTIRTDNEVKMLANAVSQMSEAMRDYVKNIVYTESKLARMIVLANKDPLTQVRNKNAYDAYAIELQSKLRGGDMRFAILMADINNLKNVNDTFGHEKGDLYIQAACRVLCEVFSHSPVFRIGGDEFAVVLIGQDYEARQDLLWQVRQRFGGLETDLSSDPWLRGSMAIGMAEYRPDQDDSVEELLRRADQAMYDEKERMKKQ